MLKKLEALKVHYAIRIGWVVVRVVLAFWMAQTGLQFYYQGF